MTVQEKTQKTTIKAYVDGYFYSREEQPCDKCGQLTNRMNQTGENICMECE